MAARDSLESSAAPAGGLSRNIFATALEQVRFLARRFVVVTLAIAGAFCGVIAVVFHRFVELSTDLLIGRALEQPGWVRIVFVLGTPMLTFAILAWVIRRFAPRAVGANLARVRRAYNDDPNILGPRTVGATFAATPLSLGAGAPLGPEGPIVVVASGFSVGLATVLRLPRNVIRAMIPIGTAAGIAAIFNTPITGVVFALEEVIGTSQRGILGGVLVGSVAAAVVERMLLGGRALLAAPFSTWTDPREFFGFAIVGVVAGLTSGLSIAIAHRLKRRWAAAVPSIVRRVAMAGLAIGAAGLIAPEIFGVGYDSVSFWLHGGGTASASAIAFGLKLVAFVIAISAGVIGGTFAPSLFLGTALGAAIGHGALTLFPEMHVDPKAYAIIGMGSFFAGLMRSPIAAVLIVIELTRDYELVIPLMLGVSLAVAISRRLSRFSIVEQQMADEGWVEHQHSNDPLADVRTAEAMTSDLVTVARTATIAEAAHHAIGTRFVFYPLLGEDGTLDRVVSRTALEAAMREGRGEEPVMTIAEEPRLVATSGDFVVHVVREMRARGVDRCPVVDSHLSRRLVGFLSPSDILRVRMANARDSSEEEFELFA